MTCFCVWRASRRIITFDRLGLDLSVSLSFNVLYGAKALALPTSSSHSTSYHRAHYFTRDPPNHTTHIFRLCNIASLANEHVANALQKIEIKHSNWMGFASLFLSPKESERERAKEHRGETAHDSY